MSDQVNTDLVMVNRFMEHMVLDGGAVEQALVAAARLHGLALLLQVPEDVQYFALALQNLEVVYGGIVCQGVVLVDGNKEMQDFEPLYPTTRYRQGGDALAHVEVMSDFYRVSFQFPQNWQFGYNPVAAVRDQQGSLVPISRSFMESVQGCERFTIDVDEGTLIHVKIGTKDEALFLVRDGVLYRSRSSNVVVVMQ